MRKLVLLALLVPSLAYAQAVKQNEAQTVVYPTALQAGPHSSVDQYANQICSLRAGTASATNPIKLEDSAHTSGDAGIPSWGVRWDSTPGSNLCGTEGDYCPLAVNGTGALHVDISTPWQFSAANSLLKQEDVASASGDAGVAFLGVNNRNLSTYNSTGGDYTPIMTGDKGILGAMIMFDSSLSGASSPVVLEGSAVNNQNAAILTSIKLQSALTVDAADGEHGTLKGGLDGRLITAPAPAGETWQACSATISSTSANAIKAAVASNRIYVTALSCTNKSGVASEISFYDGGSFIDTGWLPATASFSRSYPVPLRGTVNTAFNLQLTTVSTSTICCANGYISVN